MCTWNTGADQVIEDVADNVMDIGLVAYPARDSRLEVVLLRKDPLVLIAAPEHPIAREGKVSISALNGLKFVSFDAGHPHAQKRSTRSSRTTKSK